MTEIASTQPTEGDDMIFENGSMTDPEFTERLAKVVEPYEQTMRIKLETALEPDQMSFMVTRSAALLRLGREAFAQWERAKISNN